MVASLMLFVAMVAAFSTSCYWRFMDGLWVFLLALLFFGK
jgi:hypothetical protein